MKKRCRFAIFLTFCIVVLLSAVSVQAADAVASGYCGGEGDGTNLTWTLDSEGTLTISGSGAMADYELDWDNEENLAMGCSSPWFYYSDVRSITIDNGVTSIGDSAFLYCTNLTSIIISNSVNTIGDYAFYFCDNLTDVTIPDSVNTIGDYAFYFCDNLINVTIPDGVTTIGDEAFLYCESLTSITLPDSVTSIGNRAFYGCGLATITIPNGVTSIGNYTFASCGNLTSITLSDSVTSIGDYAFENCWSLKSITLPDSVTSIGNRAFYGCGLASIIIPDSVNYIGDLAFMLCSKLTKIDVSAGNPSYCSSDGILYSKGMTELLCFPEGKTATVFRVPDSVISIENNAFYSCKNLTSVTIPDSVASIGKCAFEYCDKLASVTIGNSVSSIGVCAFGICGSLTNVTIGSSVTSVEDNAFYCCRKLTNITIPDSVTFIGNQAFYCCESLTGIVIPDSVAFIGDEAFYGCSNLSSVAIPDSVTFMGDGAFYDCRNLSSVAVPHSISSIGSYTFFRCLSLATITIPNSMDSIGFEAFQHCILTDVYYSGSEAQWEKIQIEGGNSPLLSATIHFNSMPSETYRFQVKNAASGRVLSEVTVGYADSETLNQADTDRNGIAEVKIPVGVKGNVFIFGTDVSMKTVPVDQLSPEKLNVVYVDKKQSTSGSGEGNGRIPVKSDSTSSAVLDAALQNYDYSSLLPNISMGMDTLRGPSITVLDKTFYLFEYSGSIDIPLSKKLSIQFTVDNEEKTVKLLFGYKPLSGSTTIVGDPNTHQSANNDFWKAYTDAKNMFKKVSGKEYDKSTYDQFKNEFDKAQAMDLDMIVKASAKFSIFAEVSYETGKFVFKESGGIAAISMGTTLSSRIPAFPAAYVTLRLDASVTGKLTLIADKTVSSGVRFDLPLDVSLGAAVGIGLGDNTGEVQLYTEGGFSGELGVHVRTISTISGYGDEDPLSVDMTGKLYLEGKLKAWVFEAGKKWEWELFKFTLYPRLELLSMPETERFTMEDFLADARPVTRAYLDAVSLMGISDDYSFSRVDYPYAEPTLLRLSGGRTLLVWVGDSGLKADEDRTSIFYSVFADGAWSAPAIIWESGTYNDHPVLCQQGSNVYAVWMQADQSLAGEDADMAYAHMDLVFSCFDGSEWSEPMVISDAGNGLTEMEYAIAADAGTVSIAWSQNTENDFFMNEGTNVLYVRSLENGSWGEKTEIISTGDALTGLTMDRSSGLRVGYSVTVGEVTTTYLWDGETSIVEGAQREAKWLGGSLYELRGTTLYCDGVSTGLEGISNFTVISSDTGRAVLTLVPTGFTCELFASYYDAGTGSWGDWTQLTGYNRYIRSYSAILEESGKIVAALNLTDVDEDGENVYNNACTELVVVDDCRFTDLVVYDWLGYDNALLAPGGVLPVSFEVLNNSRETLTGVTVRAGTQEQVLACALGAGESGELTVDVLLPNDLNGYALELEVIPAYSVSESDTSNNTASAVLGLADVVISAEQPQMIGGEATIAVRVCNEGFTAAEDVVLMAYRSGLDGEVLWAEPVGTLAPGAETQVSVELPEDMMYLDDIQTMYAVQLSAETETEELALVNNEERIVFSGVIPLQVNAAKTEDGVQYSVLAENREAQAIDGILMLAIYDESGRMLELQSRSVQLGVGGYAEVQFSTVQYSGAVCGKVFWMDGESGQPVTAAWETVVQP